MTITVDQISRMSPAEVDELFRKGTTGPIPHGDATGTAIFKPGSASERVVQRLVRMVAWQGKVVNSEARELQNKILPAGVHAITADVYWDRSWFDGKECIVLDYSKRSVVARYIRDEIRKVAPRLYLGLVYWNHTRLIYFTLEFAQDTAEEFAGQTIAA